MNQHTFNSHANSYKHIKLLPSFSNELHTFSQDYIIDELNKLLTANKRIQYLGTIKKIYMPVCDFKKETFTSKRQTKNIYEYNYIYIQTGKT